MSRKPRAIACMMRALRSAFVTFMSCVISDTTGPAPASGLTAAALLPQALLAHREGRLMDAVGLYREMLRIEPAQPDALHNLGVLQMECSNAPAALPWFRAALEAQPQNPQCWLSLAEALLVTDQADEARQVLLTARAAGLDGAEADALEARITVAWVAKPDLATLRVLAEAGRFADLVAEAEGQVRRFGEIGALVAVLAEALLEIGRADEALCWLERTCTAAPDTGKLWMMRGQVLNRLGRYEEAYGSYLKVWRRAPDDVFVRTMLGRNLRDAGHEEEAAIWLALAFERAPDDDGLRGELVQVLASLDCEAQALRTLGAGEGTSFDTSGVMLAALGLDEQAAPARRGARTRPCAGPNAAERNRLMALFKAGRNAELGAFARDVVERYPLDHSGWKALGVAMKLERHLGSALIAMLLSVAAAPDDVEALCNLAMLLQDLKRDSDAAIAHCARRALMIDPDRADAHGLLGAALTRQNRLAESYASFQRALELKPDLHKVRSALLFAITGSEAGSQARRLERAHEFGRRVQVRPRDRFSWWSCPRQPQRLRIGLVSGDLRTHPVGYFLEGVLGQLGAVRLELFAYSNSDTEDALTERIRPRFAGWRQLKGIGDEAAARCIQDDGVHVLIDLSGHTLDNRLPLFACKPAPVQASWLGYFATTGVPQIDYVLADPYVAPVADEGHFVERLWRLPESYLCFSVPEHAVEPAGLPALENGFITFGCFNNLNKLNDAVVAQRARVLQAVPGSRLLLKTVLLDRPEVRAATTARFAAYGIDPQRLILEGHSPRAELLAAYNRVDIALDPFPYPGGTTSVEALWMAVPVLTRRGGSFLSRLGESICVNAGLADWIAADEDDCVRKAVAFTQDLAGLARLRTGLRDQVLASPLFDAARFARHFEEAMWGMWQRWIEQHGKKA